MPGKPLALTILFAFFSFCAYSHAVYVPFENCLSEGIVKSNPLLLQFIPLNVSAIFNATDPNNNLNITVYGNVSGIATQQPYPAPDDPQWSDPNGTVGKIVDLSASNEKYTTLFTKFNVLSYTAYEAQPARFCNATVQGKCPLAPAFHANPTDLAALPAFSVARDMYSTYAFTSITATMRVTSGDASNTDLACISASITPVLTQYLEDLITYLPLVVLCTVGAATVFAATVSPWGSLNIFRWTSNFGRDEDLLRLVTPGFGDCLQYIQFIVLTGSLTLNYPGYYQPVVSHFAWSSLMFNQSFATYGNGTQSVVDGLYYVRPNSTYGLDQISQLVGMTSVKDLWAGMIVWVVVVIAACTLLTQICFAARWLYRQLSDIREENFQGKNWPFTAGNTIRLTFNYMFLPLVSLSMFQLVIANKGPGYSVGLAAILLVAVIGLAIRLLYLFARIRPRSFLFDDMPTVLLYGPLYNTYSDDAATFALIPIFLNFLRGIAIGAVQQSGIAQLVLLAICEIVLALTLNAFRPFSSPTSMNIYHTFFSIVRLITIILMVAFVPSVGVTDASREWIGYAILLLHAAALVFGFFLNAIQTVIEVAARLAGAGGHGQLGATRGGLSKVFGMRQLSRRMARPDLATRNSMASGAAMLDVENEQKSIQLEQARCRSLSASSTQLLNRHAGSDGRSSQAFDSASAGNGTNTPPTPETVNRSSKALPTSRHVSAGSAGGIIGLKQSEAADPYYRPPRRRTLEALTPSGTRASAELKICGADSPRDGEDELGEGPSVSGQATPMQAHLANREDLEYTTNDLTRTKTDYAVREVDFYYGVRGPALSSGTRKLKTGPADPTGPVSSATGWFKGLLGGQRKEKGKGFEVVRSSRAPPPGLLPPDGARRDSAVKEQELYRDDPDSPVTRHGESAPASSASPDAELEGDYIGSYADIDEDFARSAPVPPSLPAIETGGGIEMPSRVGSNASGPTRGVRPPTLPRKSQRRKFSYEGFHEAPAIPQIPVIGVSPPSLLETTDFRGLKPSMSVRIPFSTGTEPSPAKSHRYSTGGDSTTSSFMHIGDEENQPPSYAVHTRHSSSALGAHAPDILGDRPSSMGYVPQHRASDNTHQVSPDSPEHAGSSAEFVYHHHPL